MVLSAQNVKTCSPPGSVYFKNMIKRHWRVVPDETDKIHQSDRDQIKTLIVDLMLSSPESIQRQVSLT